MKSRALPLLCLVALPACVVGAPPGFSDGDTWSMPLIAPLEDDVLLVPVTIGDKGPYLFMIDPDSEFSSVDNAIVSELSLRAYAGPEELSEADHRVNTFIAEVPEAKIGELGVRSQKWRIHKVGTFWVGGRRVRGLIGRDIIADSLVFAVDRDRGVATLAKQGKLSPPASAKTISYRNFFNRKLAKVKVNNGAEVTLHLDLGGRLSRMWPDRIRSMKLPQVPLKAKLIDELGVEQTVTGGAMAAELAVGGSVAKGIMMVPYADQRVEKTDLDGSLGQNFFANFNVVANWHKKTMWLEPRGDVHATRAERLGRWGALLGDCKTPGCVNVELVTAGASRAATGAADPTLMATPEGDETGEAAGAPAEPAPPQARTLVITREAGARDTRLEILLDAVDASGKSLGLTRLQGTFMPGENLIRAPLDPTYEAAAGFEVLDVSPLGRACQAKPCLWLQTTRY